jgi:hypothetical protein
MRIMRQMGKAAPMSALFLALALLLLAGCGSNATGGSTTDVTSATATACAQATRPATSFRTATGVLKSISGQTLLLTNTQGTDVTVTYTGSTTFTQEIKIAASDLKEGSSVRVAVTSSGSTYTAVSVLVSTGTGTGNGGGFGGFGGFGNGTPGTRRGGGNGTPGAGNPCFANRGKNGTPGTGTGTGTSGFRGLVGTVSQVNGNVLTISDSSGASYTVTLTAQTQIIETKSATAAALKVGEPLTAVGKPGSQNTFAASSIAILLALPTRRGAAATPGA